MKRAPRNSAYVRASTIKQEDSPEVQRDTILSAARAEGAEIDTWYTDIATSGKIRLDKRPAGGELCRGLNKGDTVWVAKLDRAWRSVADCCVTIDKWARAGVHVRICDMRAQFDISTPQGKAFVQMLAVFAELERGMISIRTREALAYAKREGKANGRYAGYGFSWRKVWDADKGGYVKHKVANPAERAIMRDIAKWRMEGHDFETIYHHLRKLKIKTAEGNEWSLDRVKRAYKAELQLAIAEGPRGKS